MSRDAEISLARSAAPKSISDDAEILILTKNGYQTAVRGTNGFVCMVARSWSADYESPDFWDPKLRAPICYNSVAAKSQVAATIKRTEVALGGGSKAQIQVHQDSNRQRRVAHGGRVMATDVRKVPKSRPGAHLMFFMSEPDPKSWGAGLPGSPILAFHLPGEHLIVFIIPVSTWSDGTPSLSEER